VETEEERRAPVSEAGRQVLVNAGEAAMCLGADERGTRRKRGTGRRAAFCFGGGSVARGKRKREGGSGCICVEEGGGDKRGWCSDGWHGAASNGPRPSSTGGAMPRGRGAQGVADRWTTAIVQAVATADRQPGRHNVRAVVQTGLASSKI
jgi:hypothetical protein